MAEKKIYIGSIGPLLYDDNDIIDDPDGDFSEELQKSVVSNGQMIVGQAPSASGEVVRFDELINDLRRFSALANPAMNIRLPVKKDRDFRYLFMLGR